MANGSTRGPYAKSAERRRTIIDAAREVFAEHGYRAGSLQQIADRCGMSQTTLLHHFAGKQQLLLSVLADRDERGDDIPVADRLPDSLVDRARRNESIPGIIELYTTLCAEATAAGHPARDYFAQRFAEVRASFAAEFRDLAAQGLLRPGVDPAFAAAGLVALWDGAQEQWLYDRALDVPGLIRSYLDLVLAPAP